jgi:predicted nucleotidyltransferase
LISANPPGPTPYEDVNTILHLLLRKVQAILGSQLVGFYLYGSLSLGDFDPASSDIDFLIVTADDVPEEALGRLRGMHAEIASSGLPYATRLEGSYIPRHALRRYDPANARHPTIGTDWPFQVEWHGNDWIIERHINILPFLEQQPDLDYT